MNWNHFQVCKVVACTLFVSELLVAGWQEAASFTPIATIRQSNGLFVPYIFLEASIRNEKRRIAIDLNLDKPLLSRKFLDQTGGQNDDGRYILTFDSDEKDDNEIIVLHNPNLRDDDLLSIKYNEDVVAALDIEAISQFALIFDNADDGSWTLAKDFMLECCTGKEFEEEVKDALMATILVLNDPCDSFASVLPIHHSPKGGGFILLNSLMETLPIPVKFFASSSPSLKYTELLLSHSLYQYLANSPVSRVTFLLSEENNVLAFRGSYFYPHVISRYIRAMVNSKKRYKLSDFYLLHQEVIDHETIDIFKHSIPDWLTTSLQRELMKAIMKSAFLTQKYGSLHNPKELFFKTALLPDSLSSLDYPAYLNIYHLLQREIVIYDLKQGMLYLGKKASPP